jgi:predicted adenine nucleotide alpha hydrolase (AANH) superfamily ATPase
MRLLLHVCCGPCAAWPAGNLLEQGQDLQGFFFNPNIHPYQEHQKRLDAAMELARRLEFPLLVSEGYRPELYFREVAFRESEGERCRLCYTLRLQEAAARALEMGCAGFTTSLLISPYQKHDLIRSIGTEIGERSGVPFIYHDWRPAYYEGRKQAREMGLYSQRYCGCLYSEHERFRDSKRAREGSCGSPEAEKHG